MAFKFASLLKKWGTHILPQMLYSSPAAHHTQNYTINTGTLQWPWCHPPGLAAWKQWQAFISWMYLNHNSMCLQTPLGEWLPEYCQDYQWGWQICPHTYILFHYSDQQCWAYMPAQYYPTHVGYCQWCSPTSTREKTVPATPYSVCV